MGPFKPKWLLIQNGWFETFLVQEGNLQTSTYMLVNF